MPDLAADVDLSIRSGDGKRVLLFTNYDRQPPPISLPQLLTNVRPGGTLTSITLPQHGVAVLR